MTVPNHPALTSACTDVRLLVRPSAQSHHVRMLPGSSNDAWLLLAALLRVGEGVRQCWAGWGYVWARGGCRNLGGSRGCSCHMCTGPWGSQASVWAMAGQSWVLCPGLPVQPADRWRRDVKCRRRLGIAIETTWTASSLERGGRVPQHQFP